MDMNSCSSPTGMVWAAGAGRGILVDGGGCLRASAGGRAGFCANRMVDGGFHGGALRFPTRWRCLIDAGRCGARSLTGGCRGPEGPRAWRRVSGIYSHTAGGMLREANTTFAPRMYPQFKDGWRMRDITGGALEVGTGRCLYDGAEFAWEGGERGNGAESLPGDVAGGRGGGGWVCILGGRIVCWGGEALAFGDLLVFGAASRACWRLNMPRAVAAPYTSMPARIGRR